MATWIVGGVLALVVAGAIWKIIKDKKAGKGCCGDCSKCHGSCQ